MPEFLGKALRGRQIRLELNSPGLQTVTFPGPESRMGWRPPSRAAHRPHPSWQEAP